MRRVDDARERGRGAEAALREIIVVDRGDVQGSSVEHPPVAPLEAPAAAVAALVAEPAAIEERLPITEARGERVEAFAEALLEHLEDLEGLERGLRLGEGERGQKGLAFRFKSWRGEQIDGAVAECAAGAMSAGGG